MKKIFIMLFIVVSSFLCMNYVEASNVKVTVSGVQNYDYVHEVLDLVNEERAKNNLDPLVLDNKLTEKAMIRAAEIYDTFAHTRPNNTSCFTILNDVPFWTTGENIAAWQTKPSYVMDSWMNSDGHRANILDADFKAIGIGHINVGGRNYWVQMFTDIPQSEFTKTGKNDTSITFNKDDSTFDNLDEIVRATFEVEPNSTIKLNNTKKSQSLLTDSREVVINNYKKVVIPIELYSFQSLNTNVAEVNSNGLVTIKGNGKTTIRVKYNDNSYDFNVEVTYKEPTMFNDIYTTDWYYNSVKYVYENNIIKGYTNGNFGPNDKLTRAMLVTILHRMEKEPSVSTNNKFSDVGSSWYTNAINWASDKKIVMGYGDGSFKPNNNITRQDLMVILYRYAKYKGKNMTSNSDISTYSDYNKIDDYAKEAMKWAVSKKILYGNKDGLLNPKGNATRAEVAAIIERYMKNV